MAAVAAAETRLLLLSVGAAALPGVRVGRSMALRKPCPSPSARPAVRPRPQGRRAGAARPGLAALLPSGGRGPWTLAASERGD